MPRVCAVVPTHHPDAAVLERVTLLARQVDRVIVVDDGSGAGASSILDRIDEVVDRVVRLPVNSGIAVALNIGVRHALEMGAEFVLTLDQDSVLPDDYVPVALDVYARANPVTNIGIVAVDGVNGAPALPSAISPEGFGLVPEAIQTGMLISRECFARAGLFDESLFIDCVDTEFCIRVREAGFRIAVARGTDIQHAIGRRAKLRPFGVQLRHPDGRAASYQYHSPFRRYYIARNNVDLILRFQRTHRRWVLAVVKRETGGMIVSMVSGPRRSAQVLAITTGTLHGLLRRRGRIPRWLERIVA